MKKLFLAVFTVVAFSSINAQKFNAGLSAALPIGDASDAYTFGVNLDVNYLWEVSETFHAGVASGIGHFFGDELTINILGTSVTLDIDDATFLPIAVAGRYAVSDKFILGADVGYAIGLAPNGNDGGFYYAPRVQYSVNEKLDIVIAYRGVSVDGGSFDSITLGVELGLL